MLGSALRKSISVSLIPDGDPRLRSHLGSFLGGTNTASGVRVSPATATRAAVCYGSITLTADTMAAMPLRFIDEAEDGSVQDVRPSELHAFWSPRVNPLQTRVAFVQSTYMSMLTAGEAFILPRYTNGGDVFEAWLIEAERIVEIERLDGDGGSIGLRFKVDGWTENNGWLENRPGRPVQLSHVPLHVKPGEVRGLSPVREAAELIGMSLSAQEHAARFLGDGIHMTGAIVSPAELEREEAKELLDNFNMMHAGPKGAGKVGVLTGGSDFKTFTIPPAELQFLEQMKYADSKIAELIYRCPPHLVGDVEKSSSWGAGIEEQTNNWVKFRLITLARTVESVIEADYMSKTPGRGMRFVMNGLLRGVAKDRAEFYRILWGLGVFSQNDILRLEDMPPITDGDKHYVPLNMVALGSDAAEMLGANAIARARTALELMSEGR